MVVQVFFSFSYITVITSNGTRPNATARRNPTASGLTVPKMSSPQITDGSQEDHQHSTIKLWTLSHGRRGWERVQVMLDEQTSCCTLTSLLFVEAGLDKISKPLDDRVRCKHSSHRQRVEVCLLSDSAGSAPFPFCVVEGDAMVAVMTGRESCWAPNAGYGCMAALAKKPRTAGKKLPKLTVTRASITKSQPKRQRIGGL